jgi:hypothetical protein
MQPAELIYDIYDKELLVIFEAFQEWHAYLKRSRIRYWWSPTTIIWNLSLPQNNSAAAKLTGQNISLVLTLLLNSAQAT